MNRKEMIPLRRKILVLLGFKVEMGMFDWVLRSPQGKNLRQGDTRRYKNEDEFWDGVSESTDLADLADLNLLARVEAIIIMGRGIYSRSLNGREVDDEDHKGLFSLDYFSPEGKWLASGYGACRREAWVRAIIALAERLRE
ncbi:hypothetical protein LCGC14_2336760 [marine sediment metagenome]|uniref:Uncharacterized protein n=1 Tax=marine sediment metagenome TaxID=412755 RepID=A0A0F9D0S0_9ZZZZ